MNQPSTPVPFISRLFVGHDSKFETELVFGEKGCVSPREEHAFFELIVVVEGKIQITYENINNPQLHESYSLIEVPAGTLHQISFLGDENKLVIIHPDRSLEGAAK